MRVCSVKGCDKKHLAKGYCSAHYQRIWKKGHLDLDVMRGVPVLERVMARVKSQGDCLIYIGCKTERGYGHIRDGRKMRMAHRIVYEHHRGPIPDGMEIDHLCRNRACVNADHLEAVTHRENVRRGRAGHDHASRPRTACGKFAKESEHG